MAKVFLKDPIARESFVWRLFNALEEKMDKGFGEVEEKAEKRFGKMMTQLVSEEQTILSAHSKDHTDRIEKLEKKVFGVAQG